jgi:hypothetical protein
LGAKFLVVLCAGSTLLLVQNKALDEAPYKLPGAVTKLASITFWSLAFSTGLTNLGFLLRKNLLLCSSHLLLGFPTGRSFTSSTPRHQASFLAPLPGKKKTSARGVSHAHPLLCFSFALHYFYLHRFIKNTKKISFFYSCLLCLV